MSNAPTHGAPQLTTHELVNARGECVRLLNLGARVTGLELQLAGGTRGVVLGYPSPVDYLEDHQFMGCTTGRFTNRIGGARFRIDGREYRLAANEGRHHLHGGLVGFDRCFWTKQDEASERSVTYTLLSPDGDQGYPGELQASVTYAWNDERQLTIDLEARCDRPTHVNLSNHVYFNLDGTGDILAHQLSVNARRVTTVDSDRIPTGELADIGGTALDTREARRVGELVSSKHDLLQGESGVDLNYVLDGKEPAATLTSGDRRLRLEVSTTCPGLHVYSGHQLAAPWRPWAGMCLEAQYFPDSPNRPEFPSTLLLPGDTYRERIRYAFSMPQQR